MSCSRPEQEEQARGVETHAQAFEEIRFCTGQARQTISNLALPQSMTLELQNDMSVVDGATTGRRTPINRLDDESGRCRVSRVRAQPKDFFQLTQPHTIRSTSSAISY
jgi:hypothetical protein